MIGATSARSRQAELRRAEALLIGREGVLEDLVPVGLGDGGEEIREHIGHRDGERVVAVVLLEHYVLVLAWRSTSCHASYAQAVASVAGKG